MNFVNFIVNKHRGSSVDFLRIGFDPMRMEEDECANVQGSFENWVEFVRSKCVRSSEIDLNNTLCGSSATKDSPFGFPLDLFNGFRNLTSLSLKSISMSDEDVLHLLEKCVVNLETPVVENAPHLQNVKISAQKLKQLETRDCPNLCSIDVISAPNLESLEKADGFINVGRVSFCGNAVPKLSSVSLKGILCLNVVSELRDYAPLEKLELDIELICNDPSPSHPGCGYRVTRNFPEIRNLKQLMLQTAITPTYCMMDCVFIVAACPNLENLTLRYRLKNRCSLVAHEIVEPVNDDASV